MVGVGYPPAETVNRRGKGIHEQNREAGALLTSAVMPQQHDHKTCEHTVNHTGERGMRRGNRVVEQENAREQQISGAKLQRLIRSPLCSNTMLYSAGSGGLI